MSLPYVCLQHAKMGHEGTTRRDGKRDRDTRDSSPSAVETSLKEEEDEHEHILESYLSDSSGRENTS